MTNFRQIFINGICLNVKQALRYLQMAVEISQYLNFILHKIRPIEL